MRLAKALFVHYSDERKLLDKYKVWLLFWWIFIKSEHLEKFPVNLSFWLKPAVLTFETVSNNCLKVELSREENLKFQSPRLTAT